MSQPYTERRSGGSAVASAASTRLSGSRLIIARTVWLALVIPSMALFVASLRCTMHKSRGRVLIP